MPFIQRPVTDAARSRAISAFVRKIQNTDAGDRLVSEDTATALLAFAPTWETETRERGEALAAQAATTSALLLAAGTLRMTTSHFIQVYNLAIARGEMSAAGRAHYELPVSEETVPSLDAEPDLLLWAGRLVAGEPRRTAALGEPAMSNPSAAQVATALQAYQTVLATQTTAKDHHDGEQEDVAALRPEADRLIKDAWDEIEFALRRLDPPSLRRRAREWGVFYALRPGEPEEPETPEEPAA